MMFFMFFLLFSFSVMVRMCFVLKWQCQPAIKIIPEKAVFIRKGKGTGFRGKPGSCEPGNAPLTRDGASQEAAQDVYLCSG